MPESRNAEAANFFLVAFIIVVVLLVPLYAALVGSIVLIYGTEYLSLWKNPDYLIKFYIQLIDYWKAYKEALPQNFITKLVGPPAGTFGGSLILLFLMRAPLIDFRPFKKPESVHGDAKWADEKDIRKAGMRAKKGVMMGRTGKADYLIAGGYQHILLFAPTGSGKGVGFVIPNLLFWEESLVVHDIKLENYELSSGWRSTKMKQQVFCWNPADPDGRTHCYNPVDWVSDKAGQQVDDVQKIANLLLPEQEFWQNEARSLFVGVLLYLVAVPEKVKSFGEVVRTMRSDDVVYNLAVVLDTIGKKIHPVAYMNIAAFLQKADKERSGVISTLNSSLELWANPLIDTATASSDFDMQQLRREKISVFVGVTPDNLQRLKPLLQVFYQQCSDFMTRKMPQPDEKHGVLMMMDEFPTLGEMPQFEAGIAYFRGYKVRLFLIVQDTQQLKGIYEEAGMNSFLSNATFRITFAANNVETANLISQLIGNKTMKQYSFNKPRFLDLNPASRTMHESEVSRALLLPQEVINMPRDEQIILIEAYPPIRTKKIFYFKDRFFTKRLLPMQELPVQEPYDPRKKQAPKPKPGSKPAEEAQPSAAPPPPPPPPATAEKPPEPPKDSPPLPPLPELPPPPAKPEPLPTLPPLPPIPEPKKPEAVGDKKEEKPAAASPFDLPPLPPLEPKKKEEDKKEAPAEPSNPFDLPPLPAPRPKEEEEESSAAPVSPFDLPPLPPLEPKQKDEPKEEKTTPPPKPEEKKEEKKKEEEKPAAAEPFNPFAIAPLTAADRKKNFWEEYEEEEGGETGEEESSSEEDAKPEEQKKAESTPAPTALPVNPFDLPPLPAAKEEAPEDKKDEEETESGDSPFELPPLPLPAEKPKPQKKKLADEEEEPEEYEMPPPPPMPQGSESAEKSNPEDLPPLPKTEAKPKPAPKAKSESEPEKKPEPKPTPAPKVETPTEEPKPTVIKGVPSFFAGPAKPVKKPEGGGS